MPKKPRVRVEGEVNQGPDHQRLAAGYAAMAADEAREADVREWVDAFAGDIADGPQREPSSQLL